MQESRRVAVLDLTSGTSVWAELGEAATAAGAGRAGSAAPAPPAPRALRWSMPLVSNDGARVVVSVRAADNKDRWLAALDPATGTTRLLDHLHDEAWVREVGGFGGALSGLGWLPDDRTVWFLSERDGWMHLYVVDAAEPGATPRQLTEGRWEITAAQLTPDRRQFLLTSTEAHPGERQVYTMGLDGGPRTRLTTATGAHGVAISPDGSRMADIHSTGNQPPEVFLGPARAGAAPIRITTSPTEEWRSCPWLNPEPLTFTARDGATVYARLYTPEMVGARRDPQAPGVVFVHGAGYLQNAHRYWST